MSADILDRIAAIDPAQTMPEATREDDERLVAGIVASTPTPRPLPTDRRSRIRWIALAGAALLLLGGATAYAAEYVLLPPPTPPPADPGMTWTQFRDEYLEWTTKIELPAGVSWNEFERPYDYANTRYGTGMGAMDAIEQAIGRWAQEWIAAAKDRDQRRVAAASASIARLRGAMQSNTEGMSENQGNYDQSILDELDAAIAAAGESRFEPLAAFTEWAKPRHYGAAPEVYQGTEYPVGWIGECPDGLSTDELNALRVPASEVRAEYASVLQEVGLPQSAPWRDWPPSNEWRMKGDGFTAAVDYAWRAWWREWVAAAEAGEPERIVAAEAASARLHDLVSKRWPSDPSAEEWVSLDAETLDVFERLDAGARRGDLQGIKDWLDYQDWYRDRIRDAAGY
jgi:hypothetical protein